MKMNQNHNLFSFLSRGVTTTHPWCSVFILSICFVFCSNVISSKAASQSDIPEMTDWQFAQAVDAYADLSDSQKEIADFLVGCQGYTYAGLANNNLDSNFNSYSDVVDYVKNFGNRMWQSFNTHVDGVVQNGRNNLLAIRNDLSNFFGNAVTYAKSKSESFSAWLGNVGIDYNSSSEFRVQFGKDQVADNIDFFGDLGLYNWQFYPIQYDELGSISWVTKTLNTSQQASYDTYLSLIHFPVKANAPKNSYFCKNVILSSTYLVRYNNLFFNTSSGVVNLVDANGNAYYISFEPDQGLWFRDSSIPYVEYEENITGDNFLLSMTNYNFSSFTSLKLALQHVLNNPSVMFSTTCYVDISSYLNVVWYGPDWEHKQVFNLNSDFNLASTSQYVTVNSPTNIIYIDLNGFIRDLYDNQTNIYNYVINNSIDGNGDPVDPSGLEPVSKFPGIPDSGITIGTEFFKINGLNPLFGSGGYIDALWNNTKGLVLYIGDIFEVLTLDSIDGGGFAWVIYGAVSVGVIGGIFSKFLL